MHRCGRTVNHTLCVLSAASLVCLATPFAMATPAETPSSESTNAAVTPVNDPQLAQILATSPLNSAPTAPKRTPESGKLISAKPAQLMINDTLWLSNSKTISYRSTDSLGRPSTDSAIYIEPKASWTGFGKRPLIAFAPGTQGGGTECDATSSMQGGLSIKIDNRDVVAPYEAASIIDHLRRGAAVVMIDHHRNSDNHQEYVDHISAGQSLLDAAVAAQSLGENSADTPVVLFGYSQGGGASAAAAERASFYAPELKLVSAYAGGVPANLPKVLQKIDGTALTGALALALAAVLDKDPALRDYIYDKEITPETASALANAQQICAGGLIANYGFSSTKQWTKDGHSLSEMIKKYPVFEKELLRQSIGNFKPSMPTLVLHGVNDDFIPMDQAHDMYESWLAQGADVTFYEDALPPIPGRTGLNHILPWTENIERSTEFVWRYLPHQKELLPIPGIHT